MSCSLWSHCVLHSLLHLVGSHKRQQQTGTLPASWWVTVLSYAGYSTLISLNWVSRCLNFSILKSEILKYDLCEGRKHVYLPTWHPWSQSQSPTLIRPQNTCWLTRLTSVLGQTTWSLIFQDGTPIFTCISKNFLRDCPCICLISGWVVHRIYAENSIPGSALNSWP